MRKSTMIMTYAAASLGLSASAALLAQPAETPASDNAATPADPATPATPADPSTSTAATPATPASPAAPATKEEAPAPGSATMDTEEKDKAAMEKGEKKPR